MSSTSSASTTTTTTTGTQPVVKRRRRNAAGASALQRRSVFNEKSCPQNIDERNLSLASEGTEIAASLFSQCSRDYHALYDGDTLSARFNFEYYAYEWPKSMPTLAATAAAAASPSSSSLVASHFCTNSDQVYKCAFCENTTTAARERALVFASSRRPVRLVCEACVNKNFAPK
jgi:hypothetical protein